MAVAILPLYVLRKYVNRDRFFFPTICVHQYSLHLCMCAAPGLSTHMEGMPVHDRERHVWTSQDVVSQAKFFDDTHLHTHWKWKERARPAMRFFVNFCETHYNHTPRCALCGCYLGGPGAGHLQSRNHFK